MSLSGTFDTRSPRGCLFRARLAAPLGCGGSGCPLVDATLGQRVELLVGSLLFSQIGLEEAHYVVTAKLFSPGDQRAIAGNLVVLDRLKKDKAKALDMFNKGEGGFKDRDLYVFCANASDGIMTAHPYGYKGKELREILGKKGYPFGQEIMEKATEGDLTEVSYWWTRPGSDDQVKKTTYYTKVGDQICGVGYYQD